MSSIVTESIDTIANLIAYQGFNPTEFIRHLRAIEPDESILGQEMQVLCLLAVNRGVKISKVTQKMKPEGVRIINALASKYRVIDAKPRSPTDVTISRIAATFPNSCGHHLAKGRGRVIGEKHPDLPIVFCFPAGGSLIPSTYVRTIAAWKEWRQSFSNVINSDSNLAVDYDEIVLNSSSMSESEKIKFCELHGIKGDMLVSNFMNFSEEEPKIRKERKQK